MVRPETDIAQQVEQAVAPLLAHHGFELVLAQYQPRGRVLRLFIDHANGVSLDDCTRVSHLVSDLLDAEGVSDHIEGRYTLEVSSPGLDRPLVKPEHFRRFVGHRVSVTTRQLLEGRRKLQGTLAEADDGGIRIEVDGQSHAVRYEDVASARLVPEL